MGKTTLLLTIEQDDGAVSSAERTINHSLSPEHMNLTSELCAQLALDMEATLRMATIMPTLPVPPKHLTSFSQRPSSSNPADIINVHGVWLEIYNSLSKATNDIAIAKTYRLTEPLVTTPETRQDWFHCHFRKLTHFNLAVFYLAKIQDLVVRLMYESFGYRYFKIDQNQPDWERTLTLRELKDALAKMVADGTLPQADCDAIVEPLQTLAAIPTAKTFIDYRNCVAHRIIPSVDITVLSPRIMSRTVIKASSPHRKPDFTFDDLYEATVVYLRAVGEMLTKLKALPRFA